ncbi:hypothetical protein [Zobellia laminariae]|uniref:hypothetical protein n=1 Tax=Zobellia laminariae TaxID=248906 RepID=UPI0026F418D8|nr:hypothetical protein [Zobellia laminariae]WKX76184.1 hypothetical protein Q5W13_21875 [Zobellia laminariae]
MATAEKIELSNRDYNELEILIEQGNDFYESGELKKALEKYESALDIIPSPKTDWEASTWLYTSIADTFFSGGNLEAAKDNYYNALNCPDGMGNGYIHLSLGQALFELKEIDKAKESFLKAYMLEGNEIFEGEDPKYFELIKSLT